MIRRKRGKTTETTRNKDSNSLKDNDIILRKLLKIGNQMLYSSQEVDVCILISNII
ncbi:MAG: hypothetical protein ACLVIY_05725 [Anaerobutyricum soehngenii]